MTIAEQSAAISAGAAAQLPAEVVAAFRADEQALRGAGVPAGVAPAGAVFPDGALLDAHGADTTFAAVRAGRPAVVVFYRGAWCPYCNLALRTYQQELAAHLEEKGYALVAISPQKPDGSLTTQETNGLSFDVLSDPGLQIARQLGILTVASDDALAAQRQLGLDVTSVNADGTPTLPMPTTVILDADGTIRWIDVHPDYTTRTETAEILARL
jgi:peroxiredoxin